MAKYKRPQIKIVAVDKLPTREDKTWCYPFEELDYILDQIKDGDRDNEETFYLYNGYLYESYETDEW